jgi:hypothetical protein
MTVVFKKVLCLEPAHVCDTGNMVDAHSAAPPGVKIQEHRQASPAPGAQHSNCLQNALELLSGRPV